MIKHFTLDKPEIFLGAIGRKLEFWKYQNIVLATNDAITGSNLEKYHVVFACLSYFLNILISISLLVSVEVQTVTDVWQAGVIISVKV